MAGAEMNSVTHGPVGSGFRPMSTRNQLALHHRRCNRGGDMMVFEAYHCFPEFIVYSYSSQATNGLLTSGILRTIFFSHRPRILVPAPPAG